MRYRGSSANNPNLMYHEECDRHIRTGGGKDSRSGFSRNGRDGDCNSSSSSYRDRRNSLNSDQSYGASRGFNPPSGSHSSGGGAQDPPSQLHGQFVQQPPAPPGSGGLQPLMGQQFAPPQPPFMGFIGQLPFSFTAPPPPPPPGTALPQQ